MQTPLWRPSQQHIKQTQMYAFLQQINASFGLELESYEDLYAWSLQYPEAFWEQIWSQCEVIASHKGRHVFQPGNQIYNGHWFPEARLNFAENLLRYRDDHPALIFRNENNYRQEISYAELFQRTAQLASAMRTQGIQAGDVVAGFLPNLPEAVIAMLATASLGAVWTSCSPDFGFQGILDRFGQVQPKLLFCADGYFYNGKAIDCLGKSKQISDEIDSIEKTIVVSYLKKTTNLSAFPNATCFERFSSSAADLTFTQVGFSHPLYILYSSGTTGVPKCIVHGVGGTLLQHLKEHKLHTDLKRGDKLFYFTTCGWMMWNWLVSGLASGCTLILFDGSPFAPNPEHLWRMAEEEEISIFGTSAKYLSALEKSGIRPKELFKLNSLRSILSTGSPLAHESFDYVYRDIKTELQLASISGGTDIVSCFALGCPIRPVYAGELQCRGLGMAVDVFDEQGKTCDTGDKGELVCKQPFPSMPVYFWNDPEGTKYHSAYFKRYPDTWAHGDYAQRTKHDGVIILGRSDAVLNPGGVRIGTAEIYRQVERVSAVTDSLCIGLPNKDDTRVVLFVVLQKNLTLNEELIADIKTTIREHTSPRHVPSLIIQVGEIPRTLSGKITELAVRKVILGEEVTNQDALANPESLEQFKNLKQLDP